MSVISTLIETLVTNNERFPHRAHQMAGTLKLVEHPAFFVADECGAGKTKQVIDASQALYLAGDIDTVLVVCPGSARSTWADPDPLLGEVAKHAWGCVPNVVQEYRSGGQLPSWTAKVLNWLVTNYEYVRRPERLEALLALLEGRRTWLILDESWAVAGYSDQMKACRTLRVKRAERVTLLNGTPLSDGKAVNLFYQFAVLDPHIIGLKSMFQFKNRYCQMGGFKQKQIIGYRDLEDLNRRVAPYVLSRRTRDCFDLPPMLEPVLIEARLGEQTWRLYKQMRDEMVASLGDATATAAQAVVKGLRLAQLTSGYLGGLELDVKPDIIYNLPDYLKTKVPANPPFTHLDSDLVSSEMEDWFNAKPTAAQGQGTTTREIGREKLDALLEWLKRLEPLPERLLVWCRFRREGDRAAAALTTLYPRVARLAGGQTEAERREAKLLLEPGATGRAAVVGNQRAGGASLNLAGADTAIYLSNGLSLLERLQSVGRIERPGQTKPMRVVDAVALGPKGQKTIDHAILRAIRAKEDLANFTVRRWREILLEE